MAQENRCILKRLRFDLCAAPLDQEDWANLVQYALDSASSNIIDCAHLYPDYALEAQLLIKHAKDLLHVNHNELLDKLLSMTRVHFRLFAEGCKL